ncbi:septin-1 [Eurytemora carolleeae]|uniref:septin-1 n=1 Tax=Eurytemora carolleeae TaxID=1294199 RepID=UPI000C75A51C|nr:septin-1 [Eurytemora carolleeae]|eukprot:XP_023324603.1 septin-1-like [Eurytemora affinis]
MGESTRSYSSLTQETSGYVGFANLPNQVHRKSVKKGFEFTLMVAGESGLGKSTLINSLFQTDLYPDSYYISSFINFIVFRYLKDESGLNRKNIIDNRVHCCFYFVSPYGHGLKPLDIDFMKQLSNKVSIVPVLAKSDCLTASEIKKMKTRILDEIKENGIRIYNLPDCDTDEDEEYKVQVGQLRESIPFAVIGANASVEVAGKKVRGRQYPWGVVDVENPEHCDFIKLRTMLITHMQDLQEVTHDVHYENFRSQRLSRGGSATSGKSFAPDTTDKLLAEKDQELKRMQDMLAKMQEQMKQQSTSNLANY